ncbi:MAG: hypothetical protein N3I35_05475 [Clostridia bacterium]|nr:hypothetical protein [Clostridia bacterium]
MRIKMCKAAVTILIFVTVLYTAISTFAAAETSTAALRMRPLADKLSAVTKNDIDEGLKKYSDIGMHWGRFCIGKLTVLDIIGGGGRDRFNPDGEMSTAAFLKTVVLSLGYKIPAVTGLKWADPYIEQARKDKLIDVGEFKDYTKAITREQASKIIYRAAMLFQPDVSEPGYMGVMRCRIKDYAKIGDKYKDFFVKSYVLGYFVLGSKSVCNPQDTLTRAQACTIVIRLLDTRARAAFAVKENEYYIGTDGKKYYPIWSLDPVNAINVVEKNLKKSTGFVQKGASGLDGASWIFYESEDEAEANPVHGMDFDIGLHNDESTINMNRLCEVTLFDKKATKEKHLALIYELLKYFFEYEFPKAKTELDNIFSKDGCRIDREVKINERYLCMHGTKNISISITCKGGLNSEQYLKKYPN